MKSDEALLHLLRILYRDKYQFVAPTPATHARVIAKRSCKWASDLTDILGWSLPFQTDTVPPDIMELLNEGGVLSTAGGKFRSLVRVSSLRECLYLHSAFPTEDRNAVFFGPDSYRFADLINQELGERSVARSGHIVDIGTGAGVGAIVARTLNPDAKITMTDINPDALRLARINAAAAGMSITALHTDHLAGIEGTIDLVLANPPFIVDDRHRLYRDGGAMHGARATIDLTALTLPRLSLRGRLILYSASAIISGQDPLKVRLSAMATAHCCSLRYRELDPDVYGEELDRPAYAEVDRIALVAAIFERG